MITTTSIRIDGQIFRLPEEQDVAELKASIVDAVSGPSRFVDFDSVGHGGVSVLVTERSTVRFEVRDHEDAELCDTHAEPSLTDFDLYALG
jgi:hypothetical protein